MQLSVSDISVQVSAVSTSEGKDRCYEQACVVPVLQCGFVRENMLLLCSPVDQLIRMEFSFGSPSCPVRSFACLSHPVTFPNFPNANRDRSSAAAMHYFHFFEEYFTFYYY